LLKAVACSADNLQSLLLVKKVWQMKDLGSHSRKYGKFSTLSREGKLRSLFSNAYVFRNGKLIVDPGRAGTSPNAPDRRGTAYIFLTNMR
jgi:hypothetical protein